MEMSEAEKLCKMGLEDLARGDAPSALKCFEQVLGIEDMPKYCSHFALSIAEGRGQFQLAVTICEKAIAKEPRNPVHYLNLGKIYLMAGKNDDAIRTFREGVRHERHPEILEQLNKHGTRKPSAIPFLGRDNFLNKYLGIILKRLGLK